MRFIRRQHFISDTGAWPAYMDWTGPKVVMIGCGSRLRVSKGMVCPQLPPGPVLLQAVTAVPSLCLEIPHGWCHRICRFAPEI